MAYNEITGWSANPIREQRRHAATLRKQGYWNYMIGKPIVEMTPEELAEMFARYIGWAPEEILALSADEMIALAVLLNEDPRDLSPLQLHQRYVEADKASPAVGAIVREHDARRIRENKSW